jgi:rhodanese-related sulfurtransferase
VGSSGVVHVEDVAVQDVWARLQAEPSSVLIDVRTEAEWSYVGLPDLAAVNKRPLLVEWVKFPTNSANQGFVAELSARLSEANVPKDAELYFICRSGGRSKAAAQAMAAAGYGRCFNVADGFEGPLDPNRHRGRIAGWKSTGLPWVQG